MEDSPLTPSAVSNPPSTDLARLRAAYSRAELVEDQAHPDPILQFGQWFEEAVAMGVAEPNACTLATAGADAQPSARIVLLKGFNAEGFSFFTNYDSRKGRELADNPRAAIVFWWPELERQVRIEGSVTQLSEEESEAYFRERPRGSQLGAWASAQSSEISSRSDLEARLNDVEAEHAGRDVPRPPRWGGYRLAPLTMEFWQGRPDRLHDRLEYHRVDADAAWLRRRLAP